jgi:hypothetical protein
MELRASNIFAQSAREKSAPQLALQGAVGARRAINARGVIHYLKSTPTNVLLANLCIAQWRSRVSYATFPNDLINHTHEYITG